MQLDILLLAFSLASPLQTSAPAAATTSETAVEREPAQLIVGLRPGGHAATVLEGSPLVPVGETIVAGGRLLGVDLPPGAGPDEGGFWLAQLRRRPGVAFAEWNSETVSPDLMACRGDGDVSSQGCTQAFYDGTPSEETFETQALLQAIGADYAHRSLGSVTVLVAVIDTGIDPTHPVLADHLFGDGYDFIEEREGGWDVADGIDTDADGLVDEAYGHGTHVASTITLVNPNARILPVRVLDGDGNGSALALAQAIDFAVTSGAEVINLSLSMRSHSVAVAIALNHALDQGIDIVAAGGNTAGEDVLFPSVHPGVLSVSSVGFDERHSAFAAFGEELDVVAPGESIYAAMPDGAFAWWSGTSMSAAVATGTLSLTHSLCASYGSLWPPDLALILNCRSVDSFNPELVGLLGEGRVDARRVTQAVRRD